MKIPTRILLTGAIAGMGIHLASADTHTGPGAGATTTQPAAGAEATGVHAGLAVQRVTTLQSSRVINHLDQRLGTVTDVLVDLESGEVGYVLVSDGRTTFAGPTRPVPPQAFQIRPYEGVAGIAEGVELILQMDQATWDQAPQIEEDQIRTLNQHERAMEIHKYYGREFQPRERQPLRAQARVGAEGAGQAQQPQAEPGAQAQPGGPAQAQAQVVRLRSADQLMNINVVDAQGNNIGDVEDMLVEMTDARLSFIFIQPDTGFWETADHEFAVAPQAFTFADQERLQLNITRQQLETAPVMTEVNLKAQAAQFAQRDVQELRQTPPVFRFEAPGFFGRTDRNRN